MPIYMKVEGITGPVTGAYAGWIELQSAQLGMGRSAQSPTGSPSVSEIVVTKDRDSTSTALFKEALGGKGKRVTIDFCKAEKSAPVRYLRIELTDTLVSSYSVSGSGGGGTRPVETLALNFTNIKYDTNGPDPEPKNTKKPNGAQLGLTKVKK